MRLKITFKNDRKSEIELPINTNYYLVKLINELCYEYSRYLISLLPDKSVRVSFDKYTFSQLIIPKRLIEMDKITILSDNVYWFISSPYYQFLGILAKEFRQRRWVKIYKSWLRVENVEFMVTPEFNSEEAKFTCLSPVAISRANPTESITETDTSKYFYILPDEDEYVEYLEMDLLQKYNLLQRQKRERINFKLEFDQHYLRKRNNKIMKVIRLEREDYPFNITGVLAPFCIKAEPDVLRMIYDLGLGQFNNLGFGMVETAIKGRSGEYVESY